MAMSRNRKGVETDLFAIYKQTYILVRKITKKSCSRAYIESYETYDIEYKELDNSKIDVSIALILK